MSLNQTTGRCLQWHPHYQLHQLDETTPLTFESNGFLKRVLNPSQTSIWIEVALNEAYHPQPFHYREQVKVYELTSDEADDLRCWGLCNDSYLVQYIHYRTYQLVTYLVVPNSCGTKSRLERQYKEVTQELYENEPLMLGLQLWLMAMIQTYYQQAPLYLVSRQHLQVDLPVNQFKDRVKGGHIEVNLSYENLRTKEVHHQLIAVDTHPIQLGTRDRIRWTQYATMPMILFAP